MKKLRIIIWLVVMPTFSFSQFLDDFENYNAGQQLACQNPTEWTTWNLIPCDSVEDPYISTTKSFSGSNSVIISLWNDPVKQLGNQTSSISFIFFQVYIPSNKTGYSSILTVFEPPSYFEWGLECYFDPGGQGTLRTGFGGFDQTNFTYEHDIWLMIKIIIQMESGDSHFWINDNLIHSWDWSDGGSLTNQLAAIDFFGFSNPEMYIDNFFFNGAFCMSCPPPNPPGNLTAQTIYNPDPQVQLNWTDNSLDEYIFNIIRKNGYPNDPSNYELVGTVSFNDTQFLDSIIVIDSTYTYGIIAYNMYGFSDTSNTATITVILVPVELTSFTASVSGNDVHLNWSTATELNNSGFEILRFAQNDDNTWQKIGFIPGHGTTTEQQHYSFVDESVSSGKYQYRLKQIDYDGTFEFSDIVEVEVGLPTEFSLEQNYPNPFNPTTKIKFTIPTSPQSPPYQGGEAEQGLSVQLKVYDVLGNEVATLLNEEKPAGSYEVNFVATNLTSGIYFYQLKAEKFIQTKKMNLMK